MYKGKLKDGDLDCFSPETIEEMKEELREKRIFMQSLYDVANKINL
jgi:hypothetical protein